MLLSPPGTAWASGTWIWPVVGPVLRGFDPPRSAYGAGHRGIDIACWPGAVIGAPATGVVSFAGSVGGLRYVTLTHADGSQSTASFVDELLVRKGSTVLEGAAVATCGIGHPGAVIPHVHFGVRAVDGSYLDPLSLLLAPRLSPFLRLAPRS